MRWVSIRYLLFSVAVVINAPRPTFAQTEQYLFQMDQDKVIVSSLKGGADIASKLSPDGAMGANIMWEADCVGHKDWYVEEQRNGFTAAWGAAILHSDKLAKEAELAFNWAFKHQTSDGSFDMPSDIPMGRQIHSTAMFVEGASHSLLLMQAANIDDAYVKSRSKDLVRAAVWLATSVKGSPSANASLVNEADKYDEGHAHRQFEKAAALQEASLLTTHVSYKSLLIKAADAAIEGALNPNQPLSQLDGGFYAAYDPARGMSIEVPLQGVNPESDHPNDKYRPLNQSYDSSYQALGLYYAALYIATTQNMELRHRVERVLKKGLDWEESRILPDGRADLIGNTRVAAVNGEKDPSGNNKLFAYQTAMFAFAYGSHILSDANFERKAYTIAAYKHWIK